MKKFSVIFLILIALFASALGGCGAETADNTVTERRLSDINGTVAYASGDDNLQDTSGSSNVLSEFSTKFNKNAGNRADNIALAASALNQKIVYPGEEFSFNDTIGPANVKTGYKRSKIFIRGKETDGIGGGICQVSSTLYNAVRDAGLNVTERHPHSRKVQYVQEGGDAAVSTGGIDLKFVNDKDYPVMIRSDVSDGKLTISIVGVARVADKSLMLSA